MTLLPCVFNYDSLRDLTKIEKIVNISHDIPDKI